MSTGNLHHPHPRKLSRINIESTPSPLPQAASTPSIAYQAQGPHMPDQRQPNSPFTNPFRSPVPPASDSSFSSPSQWHVPLYGDSHDATERPHTRRVPNTNSDEFPQRRVSQIPANYTESNRMSDATLVQPARQQDNNDPYKKYSFSSYEHPYDIPPPGIAYDGAPVEYARRPVARRSVSFADDPRVKEGDSTEVKPEDPNTERALKRRGILSNMLDLYAIDKSLGANDDDGRMGRQLSEDWPRGYSTGRAGMNRVESAMSNMSTGSEIYDPDDPRVTGIRAEQLEDPDDIEKNALRQMDYRARRKHLMRARIEFNVTSMINRQEFLIKLARALMTFGAPSHRIESQLIAAARILEVEAEFIHLPGVIICSFGDQELGCSETHFIKGSGRLSLGALHKVHLIYRAVVHDEISAKKASSQLDELFDAPPLYSAWLRCFLSFMLSALICPLAFGGSFLDMWIAGAGALLLASLQISVSKSTIYANVFEIAVAILVSFIARALSSIRSQIFCYTAISSAGIVGILPGYLILSSSLELASKNIVCGSVKMVYALIYTLFLGFGLQIGSDFYLLLDPRTRHRLSDMAANLSTTKTFSGSWLAENATDSDGIPDHGSWTFTTTIAPSTLNIVEGCYRAPGFPWYLQPFPLWTSFLIVPLFSILSSLANQQPWKSRQLPVMVVISCCSYAANKIANHYIFGRSDIVSAIGAFTVGLLGNIYSRKMGGTAFTSMVTGVLFLVPSGLSQAGGITASGNGIDIGGAMIAVTIGITVGLFMSQALVYMFGSRKNAAVFSF